MHNPRLSVVLGLPLAAVCGAFASGGLRQPTTSATPGPLEDRALRRASDVTRQAPVPAATARQPVVAVVDLGRVVSSYPPYVEGRESLDERRKAELGELEELKNRIRDIDVELEVASEADLRDLRLQKKILTGSLQETLQHRQRVMFADHAALENRMYAQLQPVVADFCRSRNIDLLLRKRAWEATGDLERDMNRRHDRDVLYHSDAVDLTEALIAFVRSQ